MNTIEVHRINAFSREVSGGNPAGVVTNASELTDDDMAGVARTMGLSETAFALPPAHESRADIRLRYFTQGGAEIKLCGHATIAALHQFARLALFGLNQPGTNGIQVQTGAGTLDMNVTNEHGRSSVTFDAPDVEMTAYPLQGKAFAEAFGVPGGLINPEARILRDRRLNYVYVPTTSRELLDQQHFNFGHIREHLSEGGVVVFCLFTNETVRKDADLYARCLVPIVDGFEDPFTGSAQAGLFNTALQNRYISPHKHTIITEQGYALGRPGSAQVSQDPGSGMVQITAEAVYVSSTEVELPQ